MRVSAPAGEGRANAAVRALVARAVGVPKSAVTIARGTRSRHKLLAVADITAADVASKLGRPRDG